MVFIGFDNFANCFMNILIFLALGDTFWFSSTTFFNNVNIMFIESFSKISSTSYKLFPSIRDRQSTCYKTVLRSQIWLREMFPNSIWARINGKL